MRDLATDGDTPVYAFDGDVGHGHVHRPGRRYMCAQQ
jgi:hypothetical protein